MPQPSGKSHQAPRRALIGGLVTAVVVTFCVVERRWFTINDITTGETPEYAELQPRVYAANVETVRAAAIAACESLPRWQVLSSADGSDIHAEVRTLLFSFVDDVTIRLLPQTAPDGSAHTRVVIRSHSRVGKGDLGENARHIAALQSAMDSRLLLPASR